MIGGVGFVRGLAVMIATEGIFVWCAVTPTSELELELIQTHMAQKPVMRVEVRTRCVARESKRKRKWFGWASAVRRALAGCVWSL